MRKGWPGMGLDGRRGWERRGMRKGWPGVGLDGRRGWERRGMRLGTTGGGLDGKDAVGTAWDGVRDGRDWGGAGGVGDGGRRGWPRDWGRHRAKTGPGAAEDAYSAGDLDGDRTGGRAHRG